MKENTHKRIKRLTWALAVTLVFGGIGLFGMMLFGWDALRPSVYGAFYGGVYIGMGLNE